MVNATSTIGQRSNGPCPWKDVRCTNTLDGKQINIPDQSNAIMQVSMSWKYDHQNNFDMGILICW